MRIIAPLLLLAFSGILLAAEPRETAPAPATHSTAPVIPPKSMNFSFHDARIDDILAEMTLRLDLIIEKNDPLYTRVYINVPGKVDTDQAIGLINSILLSVKYAAVEVHREGEPRRILRVMPFDQAKKEVPMVVK